MPLLCGNQQRTRFGPVQLAPRRLQTIGVKLGTAELKQVQAEMRVTGNVDVDERRIANVQSRFPGWIRKVDADAALHLPDCVPQLTHHVERALLNGAVLVDSDVDRRDGLVFPQLAASSLGTSAQRNTPPALLKSPRTCSKSAFFQSTDEKAVSLNK